MPVLSEDRVAFLMFDAMTVPELGVGLSDEELELVYEAAQAAFGEALDPVLEHRMDYAETLGLVDHWKMGLIGNALDRVGLAGVLTVPKIDPMDLAVTNLADMVLAALGRAFGAGFGGAWNALERARLAKAFVQFCDARMRVFQPIPGAPEKFWVYHTFNAAPDSVHFFGFLELLTLRVLMAGAEDKERFLAIVLRASCDVFRLRMCSHLGGGSIAVYNSEPWPEEYQPHVDEVAIAEECESALAEFDPALFEESVRELIARSIEG